MPRVRCSERQEMLGFRKLDAYCCCKGAPARVLLEWTGLAIRGYTGLIPSIMENQMEKNMENEMETGGM